MNKLSIIIPVYNEKDTILKILSLVEAVVLPDIIKEIIIVDDKSTDGTREILGSLKDKYKIILKDKNEGKGAALRTGFEAMTGDIVIIQDADLEYDPQDYYKLIKPILDGREKVVYGSRNLNKKNQSSGFTYYWGGRLLSWLTNFLYGTKITDEPTCYKVFQADILNNLDLKCAGFEFCPEVTAKIARQGINIYEEPIKYFPRSIIDGKKIRWHDGWAAIWTLIKYRFIK